MKKNNNKGFTLVEIIIAITILGLVIVPLLNGFVTTAKVNQKARNKQNATLAAQNIMEKYSGFTIKQVAEDLQPGVVFTEDPSGIYAYSSTVPITYNGQQYDYIITMDKRNYSDPTAGTTYGEYNLTEYPEITSVDIVQDAIYAESEDVLKDALDEFVNRNVTRTSSGSRNITSSQFEQQLSRKVILDISKDATNNSKKVMITYEYTAPTGYVDPGEETYSKSLYIFSDEHLEEENRKELRNVYVLYRPYYKGRNEEIIINNPNNLEFNFFLIKLVTLSGTELRNEEEFYRLTTTLNENHIGSVGEAAMKLFTNLGTNLEDESNEPNQLTLKYYTRPSVLGNADLVKKDYFVPKYSEERIYDMRIRMYEAGGGFSADKLIVEIDKSQ